MISKDFSTGDLVWAKMKGYPPWPAKIIEPPTEVKTPSKQKKSQHYVFFFGSENYAWILDENIFHHSDKMIPTNMKKKPAQFQTAIDMILDQFKSQPKKEKPAVTDNSNDKTLDSEKSIVPLKPSLVNNTHKKVKDTSSASKSFEKMMKATQREEKMKKKKLSGSIKVLSPIRDKNMDNGENSKLHKKSKKRPSDSESTDNETFSTFPKDKRNDEYSSLILRKDPPKTKKRKKRPSGSESSENEGLRYPKERKTDDDEYSDLLASVPPNNAGYAALPICDESSISEYRHLSHNLSRSYVERPPTPTLNVETVCEILKARHVNPTDKKIGFLGLGLIGRGVVKNLLNSGHDVFIWNRSPQKYDCLLKAGAHRCLTPEDVVANSDIIFCCVSDPDAAKSLVFGNCGVLKGMEQHNGVKGYVEMTSVDPETSHEIAEAISLKGGKYLEAHVNGSRKQAEDGTLFILAAGDQALFTDCATCFHAMGKHAYFISCAVGSGSKMNLILSALNGVVCAALAECMVLVERLGLSLEDFIEVLEMSPLKCPLIMEKARAILKKDFSTNTALKHVQKDLTLAMQLGESCSQPTPVAAAANEMYKHAKQLRYSDHDVCAVYQGIKY